MDLRSHPARFRVISNEISWAKDRLVRLPQEIRNDGGRVACLSNRLQPLSNEEKQCLMVHVGRASALFR